MSNQNIYNKWTTFINHPNYAKYFISKKCLHKWKVTNDDDLYNYKKCELCGRMSRESRIAKDSGYNEPNPDKKKRLINGLPNRNTIMVKQLY